MLRVASSVAEKMDEQTYGPAEVCLAAGVARATFHSWAARNYLPLPSGPGMGRERSFTFLDAVRIAAVSQLTRLGIMVGMAGRVVGLIKEEHLQRDRGGEWAALIVAPGRPAKDGEPQKRQNVPQFGGMESAAWGHD